MIALLGFTFGAFYMVLAFWLARKATQRIKSKLANFAALVVFFCFLAILPVVDGMWGTYQLSRLCAMESGTKVLGQVLLPAAILGPDGKPKTFEDSDGVDWVKLRPYLYYKSEDTKADAFGAEIHRATYTIVRVSDGVPVVKQISFYYRGGWLRTNGQGLGAAECFGEPSLEAVLPSVVVQEM